MRKTAVAAIALGLAALAGCANPSTANPSTTGTVEVASTTGSPTTPPPASTASTAVPGLTVGREQAEQIALAAVPGSSVRETELDDGGTVWNVHLDTPSGEIEVKVDVRTGTYRLDD